LVQAAERSWGAMVLQWRSLFEFCGGHGEAYCGDLHGSIALEVLPVLSAEAGIGGKCEPRCAPLSWHCAMDRNCERGASCGLLPWCGVEGIGEWPSPSELPLPHSKDELAPVTPDDLEQSMEKVSSGVRPWVPATYNLVRHLQDALGNHGSVDMMQSNLHDGRFVAVKRMPNKWVSIGPKEFQQRYPLSPERPWVDLGLLRQLNQRNFPYTCDLQGVFCDTDSTYVVMSLARCGDLFAWCLRPPSLGPEREALMQPIITQVFVAARWLHELGIAHRDFSPENILLTDDGAEMRVRIVDFAMATSSRSCCREVRGKQAHQAPEMHEEGAYDPFPADAFQLGVVLFIMAARERPWVATQPGACQLFGQFRNDGKLLRSGPLAGASPDLLELLEGLLEVDPKRRWTLGEACFAQEGRKSVWEGSWLRGTSRVLAERWPIGRAPAAADATVGIAV